MSLYLKFISYDLWSASHGNPAEEVLAEFGLYEVSDTELDSYLDHKTKWPDKESIYVLVIDGDQVVLKAVLNEGQVFAVFPQENNTAITFISISDMRSFVVEYY